MFGVKRMHDLAARHPVEICAAHSFSITRNLNIDGRNAVHRNHHRLGTWQTNARAELTGAQNLRARFVPCHQLRSRVRLVIEEQSEKEDLIISVRLLHANAKDALDRGPATRWRRYQRHGLDP